MNAKKNAATQMTRLAAEVERCLAELKTMPRTRKYTARRAMLQTRYADLGREMRTVVLG